jgi:hypothetical protein
MFVIPDHIQFNSNLSTNLKSFLRALAHHCGDKNQCWPSQERIAQFMNCSTRTVRRMERQAIDLDFISVRRRWLQTNIYTVLCLEERQKKPNDFNLRTPGRPIEKNTILKEKTLEQSERYFSSGLKSPWETQTLVSEIEDVTRDHGSRGAFFTIARQVDAQDIYQALSATRAKLREESGVNGGRYFVGTVKALSGFRFQGSATSQPSRNERTNAEVGSPQQAHRAEPEPERMPIEQARSHLERLRQAVFRC